MTVHGWPVDAGVDDRREGAAERPTSVISLSDEGLAHVMRVTAPMLPCDRSAFLLALAGLCRQELALGRELGDGLVFRLCRDLRREFWRPPSPGDEP